MRILVKSMCQQSSERYITIYGTSHLSVMNYTIFRSHKMTQRGAIIISINTISSHTGPNLLLFCLSLNEVPCPHRRADPPFIMGAD